MFASKGNRGQSKELSKLKEENQKLKEKLKNKEEEFQRYKEGVANKGVIERWKIGKYLHDNLAQQLTSAKISISFLKDEFQEKI